MEFHPVPRFRIQGQYYTLEELPQGEGKRILSQRLVQAMREIRFHPKEELGRKK